VTTNKLTKAEIAELISESTGMTKKDIHQVVDCFFEEMKKSLLQRLVIELRGFGTFEVVTRKGRAKARNPKTGETVSVPDHGVVHFRPGKELRADTWELRQPKG